jgi:DNA-binding response OmpR family regulator
MRALIVEDEPQVAAFIAEELRTAGFSVEVAVDGVEGERMAIEQEPDILLLDWMLPKRSGLDVCRHVREQRPRVPILMLTALDGVEEQVKGFGAGADDYLPKPFDPKLLMARVQALVRRSQGRGTESILTCGDLQLDDDSRTVTRAGQEVRLTAREFALLRFLLQRKGRVTSRSEILDQVWDVSFDTETNIVDVYINMLRKKVDKPFEKRLIHTVTGMGYVIREEAP